MKTLIDRVNDVLTHEYQTTQEISAKTGIPLSNLQVALRLHMYTDRYKTDPAFYRRKLRGSNKFGYKLPKAKTSLSPEVTRALEELTRAVHNLLSKESNHASV
jgi:hypothetical protein